MAGQFSPPHVRPSRLDPARHGICRTAWAGWHAAEGGGQAMNAGTLQESPTRPGCGRSRASRLHRGPEPGLLHPARAVCRSTGNDDIGDALQAHHTDSTKSPFPGNPTVRRVGMMGVPTGMVGRGVNGGQMVWWCVSAAADFKKSWFQTGRGADRGARMRRIRCLYTGLGVDYTTKVRFGPVGSTPTPPGLTACPPLWSGLE